MSRKNVDQKALRGERTLEIRVRLWTDGIADGKGLIRPKHAWSAGFVRVKPNKSHGVTTCPDLKFNSLMELPAVLEKIFIKHGITIHPIFRMQQYLSAD